MWARFYPEMNADNVEEGVSMVLDEILDEWNGGTFPSRIRLACDNGAEFGDRFRNAIETKYGTRTDAKGKTQKQVTIVYGKPHQPNF